MKNIVIFLFFLLAQRAYSQQEFTTFAEKTPVKWAAFLTDTVRFKHPNLSLLLRQRLNGEQIKAGSVSWDDNLRIEKNISKEAIVNRVAPNQQISVLDENGNVAAIVKEAEDPLLSGTYFDKETEDLLAITQVLYLQKGNLTSFVTWVSPKQAVYTSWQQKLGIADAFSTAFNSCRNFTRRQKKQSGYLGKTTIVLGSDSSNNLKMIKQLYEHQLLDELWPSLAKNNYEIYAIDSARNISFAALSQALLKDAGSASPLYNEEGKITSYEPLQALPLSPKSFTGLALEQEWYYHSKKNKLFTRPTALLLYAHKFTNGIPDTKAAPILKIRLR